MARDFINGKKNNKKGYRFLLSLNEEQKLAKAQILENDISIILGKAGSGKTFTAVTSIYRLLKFAKAKRVLFSTFFTKK